MAETFRLTKVYALTNSFPKDQAPVLLAHIVEMIIFEFSIGHKVRQVQ